MGIATQTRQISAAFFQNHPVRRNVLVRSNKDPLWTQAGKFAQRLRNDLPVFGLIAKLTTPTGIEQESGKNYQEFSRSVYEAIDDEMNVACYDLQEEFGDSGQLRFILCACWMARYSFGSIPPKAVVQAALRLRGSRDLEYEIGQFEALREEEKQKYAYGESIDYTPLNLIPTAVDALVRLVVGVNETTPISDKTKENLSIVLRNVFPTVSRSEIESAFEDRSRRSYLYV